MLNRKFIALLIAASFGGVVIVNRFQASAPKVVSIDISAREVLAQQSSYTGTVAAVNDAAKQITVSIAAVKLGGLRSPPLGSGVILSRQGSTYYVATAGHLVVDSRQYTITTPDGTTHQLSNQAITRSDAYDLAVLSFESSQNYSVASVAQSAIERNTAGDIQNQVTFVSGFAALGEQKTWQQIITGGTMLHGADNAAGLLYRNISYPGMAGGAVLDQSGRLIGINLGTDDRLSIDDDGHQNAAIGFSKGISIYEDVSGFLAAESHLSADWIDIADASNINTSDQEWNNIVGQLLTVARPGEDADAATWMSYGNQLWRYERYAEAIDALEQSVTLDFRLDQAYYTMGLVYWDQDEDQQAIEYLKQATQFDPDVASYWYLLSSAYGAIKDDGVGLVTSLDRQIFALEKAIAADSQDFVLYMELGVLMRSLQRYEEAIAAFDNAIRLNPSHPLAYNDRAITYTISRQYEKALADYTTAISINPQFARALNNRGSTYDYMEQYENALADFNQAILISPNYASPYSNRGNTYYSLGAYDQALFSYNQALAIDPESADALRARSSLYVALQQNGQAQDDLLQRSLELNQ